MNAVETLNILAKWRAHFAGWQLGTRLKTDPESQAVRDHREITILLRVEVNAIASLLIQKRVFTVAEWEAAVVRESDVLNKSFESRFPGVRATDAGLVYTAEAAEHMKNWRP